ncbi:hypothetical protein J1N35_018829 [Gossypium stocksii]|uniref:RNase H type-1 domain-containing protein n=1 Tax=Gossypium stocksii TaxID=47602 RepID=A0A9D3VR25_9ROSI|nr:hypothetical protein J1N35_018829 [Gossypium stocksii]
MRWRTFGELADVDSKYGGVHKVTLYTDGAVSRCTSYTSASDLLHDHRGNSLAGLTQSIRCTTVEEVECLSVLKALRENSEHGIASEIGRVVARLLNQAWLVKTEHIFRLGNQANDCLAHLATNLVLGCQAIEAPPIALEQILEYDREGRIVERIRLL